MSEDRRKMNRSSTGTVPKIKCRNNTTSCPNERDSPRSWTNNLTGDFHRLNLSDYLRNSRRNHCAMNVGTVEEQRLNPALNGSITPSSSSSRRNSSGTVPKCDNITKYPDKRQIEDKLSQIQEYLQITTSLMSSMKNTDDQSYIQLGDANNLMQMINDLRDSEAKLVNILGNIEAEEQADRNDNYSESATSHHNDLDEKIDHTNREMEMLRDQQMSLLCLQQKAENKLKDARQIQEKLLTASQYDVNSSINQRNKNLSSVQDFDIAIRELEERSKRLNEPRGSNSNLQDKLLAEMDSLQSQIVTMHNINDDRNQLIQVLDNRDTELRAQHLELQNKLSELQNKKSQVDQLVAQLQVLEETDEDDVGAQVRRIVTMKEQLSKLKDMLEIVKTTELNSNASQEEQDLACGICTKAENFLQKDGEKRRTPLNKQVNKNACDRGFGGAKPKSRTNSNKVALQVELEAKKRELEEIMGKHKAGTSNLNHDVGTDNKSEFSCSSNAYFDWAPIMSDHNRFDSSDSDEYSDPNQQFVLPTLNYPKSDHDYVAHHLQDTTTDRLSSIPRTPERRTPRAASEQGKNQVQKQLELIRSVCDSMLDQQGGTNVRNNLTPSSLYFEPRPMNTTAIVDPNYQSWLATNTLQTQAFMLNTLNQCCQMLWLQQRELISLRQTVNQLQDYGGNLASPLQSECRSRSNQKGGNQVAAACSMPNLNQYNIPPSVNLDPSSSYQNNMQNARLLDHCLNNVSDHNNSVLHAVNANTNQIPPTHMWNGQALNNQVAPGNRANNYWDNFRSYSRQNLLSTKSNEGFQNISNNPFTLVTTPKCNSDQMSSQENTPRRRTQFRNNNSVVPPDVLNVNKVDQRNINECDYNNESNSTISEEHTIFKESASRRNEWHEEQVDDHHTKSKLFEELRENVYKEVVTLISANETRPHFLIQLFRDLQMISSDPLRLKILQAIQTIITHNLTTNHTNRQVFEPQQSEPIDLQSTVWSKKIIKNQTATSRNTLDDNRVIKEIIPFLNDHEDDSITHPFLVSLKQVLLESESFQETVRDSVFKKHFSNVLDEVLAQYQGKKVHDVKMHFIQTVSDLLRGELSFIQLIQDTCPDGGELETFETNVNQEVTIQNGDLAEADQGRVEEDDGEVEEEGAVGGFWELPLEVSEDVEVPSTEFQNNAEAQTQFIKQGLDQVPTRLPTKSPSNTPSKDRSTSSRSDHHDLF
ncbi:pericentriolar material 1 protein isoform X2 [Tribolium castaneum]|uniref:pericentriolar material 1 protein isoform X2 n=1 Tax=Tribolium castaneum TaxID=7070 RepID=UPI00046BF198|nr:PREDICTED: pericentriolar material 1 protein isoform X2 [Tribolium castaneum]|eukprot:XP_008191614.1 PREDICTED: pericentriolar material 1 protein isoform X2 [Tribolium castaneum]